jgi:hypothetical protein
MTTALFNKREGELGREHVIFEKAIVAFSFDVDSKLFEEMGSQINWQVIKRASITSREIFDKIIMQRHGMSPLYCVIIV